jgi:hypothetical protein
MKKNAQEIHQDNWTHGLYRKGNLRALIHEGADWDELAQTPRTIYTVNVLNEEHQAVQSFDFAELESATKHINETFQGRWFFEDQLKQAPKNDDEGGCSSCQAH